MGEEELIGQRALQHWSKPFGPCRPSCHTRLVQFAPKPSQTFQSIYLSKCLLKVIIVSLWQLFPDTDYPRSEKVAPEVFLKSLPSLLKPMPPSFRILYPGGKDCEWSLKHSECTCVNASRLTCRSWSIKSPLSARKDPACTSTPYCASLQAQLTSRLISSASFSTKRLWIPPCDSFSFKFVHVEFLK